MVKKIEHAGHAYHDRVVKMLEEAEDYEAVEEAFEHHTGISGKEQFVCDVESVQHAKHEDYYALLGISHLGRYATHDQIRKACNAHFLKYMFFKFLF
jgi:hypothetical protein